ncbi:hypothetical protein O181_065774 [Austropuccinia psidii MF-1]|uniref:Integrase catalytic domain-containing protein n=1 Tax=Austropuccinia psidii MF-1 TaxID=1389203 RepID=A0A9Q3I4V7_9BASI|nr:hypothetical protein [Austropuccinia psidii MF-1]
MAFPGLNGEVIVIKNVFYSPNATATLISPASILRTGGKMYTQGDNLLFCNTHSVPLLIANFNAQRRYERDNGISAKNESLLWHKLFGHCGMQRLRNFLKDRIGADIASKQAPTDKTPDGAYGHHRERFDGTLQQSEHQLGALGAHYTGHWFDIRWEVKCGKKLKILRTDGGGKFWSKGMNHWCSMKGITHKQSLPVHHEQNRVAERYNQSVADMGRTILRSSGLGNAFWGYAFMWAAYTNNSISNEKTGRLTPAERLFNEKPQLDRMWIFGEKAYVHIPREHRQKLDDRAHEGHVVMYLQRAKGWLFYIPGANKTIPSAWATFPDSNRLMNIIRKGHPFEVLGEKPSNKMNIPFLLNNVCLGDFGKEETFTQQEKTAVKITTPSSNIPRSYKEAMGCIDKDEWSRAIEEELQNMRRMDMFEVAPLDKTRRAINGGWIFAKKIDNLSGKVRYKARYVARGNRQCYNEEYKETFAPTATFSALRLLLTWAAKQNWLVHSFDFTAAYLNAPIDMEVWIKPPDGLEVPANMGCWLKKALYGTKQAGRCWWEHLGNKLKTLGFSKSAFYNSVYFNIQNDAMTWIHVDDGIVIAKTKKDLEELKRGLESSFMIKWKDEVETMISMEIKRQLGGFTLTQKRLIGSIVSKHWDGKKTSATPLPAKSEVSTTTGTDRVIDQKSFLSIVGSLSYVANGTRPDISFAVHLLAQHAQAPRNQHWTLLQHLLGYLQHTQEKGIRLFPNQDNITVSLDASSQDLRMDTY